MNLVHKTEKPFFVIALVISILFWLLLILGTLGLGLIYLLMFYIIFLFTHSAFISYLKGVGVKVSDEQFPDLHQKLLQSCQKLGMREIPDVYVLRTDFFNALATRFLGRNFLVLFSDVLDAFEEHPDALDFYIGHELGHIHRKHLLWAPVIFPAMLLPILGFALRRAEEYTCDRYGAACVKTEEDVKFALAALAAGDTRWKKTNINAYLSQVQDTKGFWMSFHEFTSDYPWLTKRMSAALGFKNNTPVKHPTRNIFAVLFALFVPRLGMGGGFSSIIIVVAIIGILAAVAIPRYKDYADKTKNYLAYNVLMEIQGEANQYYLDNEVLPESLVDLGYDSNEFLRGKTKFTVNIYDDHIIGVVTGVSGGEEQYLYLMPDESPDGELSWACKSGNIKPELVPTNCR
jgi:Zn-dependent protease with chaperone function/type II secretory pathway pseudopilin PulG